MNIKEMPHGEVLKAEHVCVCAPCEAARDITRRKAAAFDRLERLAKRGMVVIDHEACESGLLSAVEAMEER